MRLPAPMPIYKFAIFGWTCLAAVALLYGMPYVVIYPGIYMLSLGYYFRKKYPRLSYKELFANDHALAKKISMANFVFVVTCGYHIGVLEAKFGRLYKVESLF